ncbi:NAD-dependent epimerase/dehydratase family protein [Streptococcus urinalis]|uniref:3-beta hydroxysteroid dehydrogenase/isomerase domain protein n=2 Tax=Streptococcus urinalis TaxID=149016 RepID=G5KEB4_9STRE|nr:NAD-dependent epimerase/dehydratase family protein [Streptococcus urinalis]EHJ56096.1 3-beta hydroxysteroid dehydrogenase/isomerase domain protein [Streptococcus urinalis 2285-97]VEF32891.1 NADH dehydrogenase [Streptococcus urinalis]
MTKRKIVIAGGTGFVGQGIIKCLDTNQYDIHSLSRHPFKGEHKEVHYHVIDLKDTRQLEKILDGADWVIDAIGILFANPRKNQTYQKNSIEPAKALINGVQKDQKTKFLFISANTAPFFLKDYIKAKREVERYGFEQLKNRQHVVYPGLIYDKDRREIFYLGKAISLFSSVNFVTKCRVIQRKDFALEVKSILEEKSSYLENKI